MCLPSVFHLRHGKDDAFIHHEILGEAIDGDV
jgi:hypothetical protein